MYYIYILHDDRSKDNGTCIIYISHDDRSKDNGTCIIYILHDDRSKDNGNIYYMTTDRRIMVHVLCIYVTWCTLYRAAHRK